MDRRSWMTAILVVLIAGTVPALSQIVRATKPVAVVNGVAISTKDLDAVLASAGPAPVEMPKAQLRQRQVEALGLLIDTVLMRQFLEQQIPPVSADEVSRRLKEMEVGLVAQGKSLTEFCHDTNQTEEQLRASIADHLRWSAYTAKFVTETTVEQYFKDNQDFFDDVKVEASHIVLRVSATSTAAEKETARTELQKIRTQLMTDPKADFAALAKQHSQDPRADKGGELGSFPRKWVFDEAFSKAAFALKEGEISDIVETEYGLHLIKVTKRKPGTQADFAKIKETVREFCAEEMRQQILAKERKAAKIEINLP
jgi:peptidyl-prolyl cis-trans isomerase C